MSAFHFPLQKVLEWRRTQLELEEAQYRRQMAALVALDRQRAEIDAAGKSAERQVREWNPLAGGELAALGGFRLHVQRRQQEMVAPRAECSKQLQRQQEIMLEARRRLRLLERLKDRRMAEWRAARDKGLEALASESYLAKWQRRRKATAAPSDNPPAARD
jgi:flagellar export protein FliJ